MEEILYYNKYKGKSKNIRVKNIKAKAKTKITEMKYIIMDGNLYERKKNIYNNFISFLNNNKIKSKKNIINLQKTVKSLHILKFIFSFITKKNKFKLIINNKEFQNKFKIDIEDYKKESGKYIIGEKMEMELNMIYIQI